MKMGLFSLLVGTALMAAVAAQAEEAITLDNSQMDKVVAGNALFTLDDGSVATAAVGGGGAVSNATNATAFTQSFGNSTGGAGFAGCGSCSLFLN